MESEAKLRNESATYRNRAVQHSEAAKQAQNRVNEINGKISGTQSRIQAVVNFKNGTLTGLETTNNTLTNDLKNMGTAVGVGLADESAGSHAKSLNKNNGVQLKIVRDKCDAIISRLNRDLTSLNQSLTKAQSDLKSENAAVTSNQRLQQQVDNELQQN
ncbi:hypothetical protein OZX72_04120 [Bifidobacterium sp. ESL0769]|uniref:hypothetical protein n=1 Tax=Bifidobacterium sp. ESL0769 TaxID=2983229 RepID=UPI0023F7CC22|nr:hypothetical protein [Bifidobacterium sp. ESL0769]WEV68172.1 hypothetical protein OZX72_04120 [Bifidobacterium sp. ESL0769]